MLHNNNWKFVRLLSKEYMRANKLRNVIAILAIMLTTMMFASVLTVYEGSSMSIHEQMLYQCGNRFMVSIRNVESERGKCIKRDPLFLDIYEVGYLGEVDGKKASLPVLMKYADEGYVKGAYVNYVAGAHPTGGNEVGVPKAFLAQNGSSASVGDDIFIDYSVNGEARRKKMKISGIYEGHPNEAASDVYVSREFYDEEISRTPPAVDAGLKAGNVSLYGNFQSEENLEENLGRVLSRAGYDVGAFPGGAGEVDAVANMAYQMNVKAGSQEIKVFCILVSLILTAGFLIIFNVFKISVMKDIRTYGQLKTIGASPKQLRKLVEYQAVRMALVGIPTGTVLGWGLGNLALPMIMSVTTYRESLLVMPDMWIVSATVLFSFITVWVSCKIPAFAVSRMSPVQALKYQGRERNGHRKMKRGRESRHRILDMAMTNLAENRGRTILVIFSIALSIILFNGVLNFTLTFSRDTYMTGQTGAEFNVYNPTFTAGARLFFDDTDALSEQFVDGVANIGGIEDGGFVYFHGKPMDIPESGLRNGYNGIVTAEILELNGRHYANDPVQEVGQALYGFDDNVLKRVDVIEGELDFEKLKSGNYVVEAIISDDNGTDYKESMLAAHAGDKIRARIGEQSFEYEVLACISVNSKLISPTQPGDPTFMVLPSDEFLRLFPGKRPVRFLCDSKQGAYRQVQAYFEGQAGQGNIAFESSRSIGAEFDIFTNVYRVTGNLFAAIFGILGLLNLLNVIIIGAISRQRESAVMQSVGMTKKQLRKLFMFEGAGFTVLAALLGVAASGLVSILVIKDLADGFWFCTYRFTVLPAVCISVPYILCAVFLSAFVNEVWNGGTIVEKLRTSK